MNRLLLPLLATSAFAADFPKPFNSEKGDPMSAEEAAATMQLPPGFKCVVFASEPDVQQPIAMTWDAKGRLWVAENYTYAENPARWDTKLRDRIIILEDKDGDGKHDGRKVFWDQGAYLTSVEWGHGGAWILNDGTLSFIADKNGDDVPDAAPQILLDGFNTKTIGHNIVNGLRWGPDGWLYGRHGITDTSAVGAPGTPNEKRVKMNCAIWRYHPTRKILETVAHGGTNSWGHDWNAEGELFMINTVIGHLWHVIPGAYYRRMFGTHLNPHVYEVIEQTADHFHWDTGAEKWSDIRTGISNKTLELGGGHAHVGMLIYQGGTWPKEYHGKMLTCNLHGRRINVDTLEREGCGYVGKHAPDFMQAKDPWFRGLDLITGPDGNVFVSDWSDSGECHDNDGVHRTSGRIYKIVYGEPKKAEPFDVAAMKDEELVKLLGSENNWWSRKATFELQQKMYNMQVDGAEPSKSPHALRKEVRNNSAKSGETTFILGALFSDFEGRAHMRNYMEWAEYLNAKEESVRATVINFLVADNDTQGEWSEALALAPRTLQQNALHSPDPQVLEDEIAMWRFEGKSKLLPLLKVFAEMAKNDSSGLIRLHLASALQRLPLDARWPIATALAQRTEDANDRQQPLMIWYGIESAVAADPMRGVELIASAKIPTVRRLVARRITEEIEKQPAAVEALVALLGKQPELQKDILDGMSAALNGWNKAPKPKGWDEVAKLLETRSEAILASSGEGKMPSLLENVRQLSTIFGGGRPMEELIPIVKDMEGDASARRNAFASLTRSAKPELLPLIRGLVNDKVIGTEARSALAAYDDPSIPKALLQPWPGRSLEQQTATVNTLISRPAYAHALLDTLKAGKVPASVISPYQARAIVSLKNEALTKKLTEVWGELRDTPEAKKAEMAKWTAALTPAALAKGEAPKGKMVFMAACAACHKLYGEGGMIGPDLTGGDRHKLTYLLENILDPSAIVPADYRMTVFKLKDGRTITGVIPEQNPKTVTVQTPAERLTLERAEITEQQQLSMSLMPEGLLTALGEEQVIHLMAYLQSLGPVQ
ncbi:PVC-type heme-binding CxxCH protein [Prosthecobacter dejongeii]|uniref:Putative membrane-bound dehydrogenase-like protein n=1 Tax=Prosthecobacter dejongeii TaxID=48465 RepID=A0A7W7YK46_9BACT|nr:PVC-type heme-binding CxxCH protein [Prosthecobacter dejongeii]MBB5037599.1 putative membrane-bound dehydrogenase-like protein [Prosthecobacter dejongeii]